MKRPSAFVLFLALLLAIITSNAEESSIWHVKIDSQPLGPVETHLQVTRQGGVLRARSLSSSVDVLRPLPGERSVSEGLMVFEAQRGEDGGYTGQVLAPWADGAITLRFNGDSFEGSIDNGIFAGSISATRVAEASPIRDYPAILESFDTVVASKVFSPGDLDTATYRNFRARLGQVAELASDDLDLLFGFRWLWQNDPFSHFELRRSHQTAPQLFEFFDSYRVGFDAATVEFEGDLAILTVRTMMGADTIEQIVAAYDRIAEKQPVALIIDLRGNGGGAFAVKPLVEHVIDEPVDAGYFISQVWNRKSDELPSAEAVLATAPWQGWSIIGFWKVVQESDIVRVRFNPAEPNFDGPVYVLLDERSASAAELAADALRSSGVTTLVGRQSAGHMLSQSMFDVSDGFIVSLPVADYYSIANGRIEGNGVPVHVDADPEQALEIARDLAQNRLSGTD